MRTLAAGEEPRADETVSEFSNTSAHVIHVSIGDGAFITIPPTVGAATVRIALRDRAPAHQGLGHGYVFRVDRTRRARSGAARTATELPPPEGGEGGVLGTDPDAPSSFHRSRRAVEMPCRATRSGQQAAETEPAAEHDCRHAAHRHSEGRIPCACCPAGFAHGATDRGPEGPLRPAACSPYISSVCRRLFTDVTALPTPPPEGGDA